MKNIAFSITAVPCLIISTLALSHWDTPCDHENGHPLIQKSNFTFKFKIQGFNNKEFEADSTETLEKIEGDIKRKANKGAILNKSYNITDYEIGQAERYNAVESVMCDLITLCEPTENISGCFIGECIVETLYDTGTTPAGAEYTLLRSIQLVFKVGFYDQFEYTDFLGPFPLKSEVDLTLNTVPPYKMDTNTTSIFEDSETIFFAATLSFNSIIQVRYV